MADVKPSLLMATMPEAASNPVDAHFVLDELPKPVLGELGDYFPPKCYWSIGHYSATLYVQIVLKFADIRYLVY